MIDVIEKVAPGCVIQLPQSNETWKMHMLAFVDDKRDYVNSTTNQISIDIIKAMEQLVSSSNELHHLSGGALELSKCSWYMLQWSFTRNDKSILKQTKGKLFIKHKESNIASKQMKTSSPTTYLGLTSQPDGSQNAQYKIIKESAEKTSRKLTIIHLTHYMGHTYYQCLINSKLGYPLVSTSLRNKQINSIYKVFHPTVIASYRC